MTRRGRPRHQKGYVRAGSRPGTWQLHWFEYIRNPETGEEKRRHKCETVGDGQMRKFEAEDQLRRFLEKINPLTSKRINKMDGSYTFDWFADNRWKPLHEGNWRVDTSKKTNERALRHIISQFGNTAINQIDKVALKMWLTKLAENFSREFIGKCRWMIRSICREAVEQGFIEVDPARRLDMPETRKPDRTVLDWSHYARILAALDSERDQLIVKVGSSSAVRPEELFAFRWRSLRKIEYRSIHDEIRTGWVLEIAETFQEGKLRSFAKTENSEGYVAIPTALAGELMAFRMRTPFPNDDDFIFCNHLGRPESHFVGTKLAAVKNKLRLPKLTFRILRRSFGTRAISSRHGSVKDVQAQLRHAKPDMSLLRYIEPVEESRFEMVNRFYEKMLGDGKGRVQ